jgi:hypothetical protein
MFCAVYGGFIGEVMDVLVCKNEVVFMLVGPLVALEALSKMLAGGIKVGATNPPPTNQQLTYAVSTTYPTTRSKY